MFLNLDTIDEHKEALIDCTGERLTYGRVRELMASIGRAVIRRSVVFVLCRNTAGCVVGYLGFTDNGAVPVMLSDKIDRSLLDSLISVYEPAYIWVPEEQSESFDYERVYGVYGYVLLKTGNDIYPVNENLQLCMTTSGSTGSPKFVRYKTGNLEANARNVAKAFGWTSEERPVCDLGVQYTMGLNVINTHLYVGATLLLTTYNLFSGDFWDFVKKEEATNFTGVPFSFEILSRLHFERMNLPNLRTLSQGGGKLTDDMFKKFAGYAEDNGKRFIASFGTTETSARMACLSPEMATVKTGSIGKAIPEGELFLIDDNGNLLNSPEAEGELCYKGPNVTMGYAVCKEDLIKGDEFGGVYHTGDLARRDADGFYYITGRLSRFLKLLSYRVSLDQTERLISQKFSCECACSGNDQIMNIYITDGSIRSEVLEYVSETTGLYRSLFRIIPVSELERNETGKVQYKVMDSMYIEKDFTNGK